MMRELSIAERLGQRETFVDLWVNEFMAEISHAEAVSRGNASARRDESLALLFNVSCALVSLVPIPGVALGWMAMPSLLKGILALSQGVGEVFSLTQQYTTNFIKGEIASNLTSTSSKLPTSQQIDHELMRVLVRRLGIQIARRYEHVLMERLSVQPDEALVGLARVGARRCVGYLATHPLPQSALDERIAHLLSGVVLGQEVPWYKRPLQGLNKEKLKSRDEASFLELNAEGVLMHGAWYDDVGVYQDDKTNWLSSTFLQRLSPEWEGLPKYGYVSGKLKTHMAVYPDVKPGFKAWQERRLSKAVTMLEITDYLNSIHVMEAKAQQRTASMNLSAFLGVPECTLIFTGDLTSLTLAHGNFEGVDFSSSHLSGDVSYTSFKGATLYGCTFHAIYSTSQSQVNFSESALGFSVFEHAQLSGEVDFTQANLSAVHLKDARLGRVKHLGAIWHKAVLDGLLDDELSKAQAQQVVALTQIQQKQVNDLFALEQRIAQMEADYQTRLQGALTDKERQDLEDLLRHDANRLVFEAYATSKLSELSQRTDANALEITRLHEQLETMHRETSHQLQDHAQAIKALQEKIQQLLVQSSTEDNRIPKTLAKILHMHERTLSHKLADLHYYIPNQVVERIPGSQSLVDYVQQSEKGEITELASDLSTSMEEYLISPKQVFLLLGDPGAGKSLFAWQHSQLRLNQYVSLLEQRASTNTWIPLVIELKHYRLSEVRDLLPRYLAEEVGLSQEAISRLCDSKDSSHRLLVIFDGFDELKQEAENDTKTVQQTFQDFFKTSGADRWHAGQIKIMVTCRVRHLENSFMEMRYFGQGAHHAFFRRVLLPFTLSKVYAYLKERANTLPLSEYQSAIEDSPSLNGMVRNPFILRLFAEALPDLHQRGIHTIKRYDIYEVFVRQWFLREIDRFSLPQKQLLGIERPGDEIKIMEQFLYYAGMLAIQMYQHDALVVSFHKNDSAFGVWRSFDDLITLQTLDEESIKKRLANEYGGLSAVERNRLKRQGIPDEASYVLSKLEESLTLTENQVTTHLEHFKISSPLQSRGDQQGFIHKSFYEFFLAYGIVQLAGYDAPLSERVDRTLEGLNALKTHLSRRIHHEPQALLFLEDIWIEKSTPNISRLKETFFAVIESSKGRPERGTSAANAITILNWMGVSLAHQSWKEIQIPGANLSNAILAHSDLSEANLQGARLYHAYLKDTHLSKANLSDLSFGEKAPIDAKGTVLAITYHPHLPWIAFASDKTIVQYNYETETLVGKPIIGHTDYVRSVVYSPSGQYLASSSDDKTVRQWESSTGGVPFGPVMTGHTNGVTSIAYSPSGQYLASSSEDKTVRQWESSTGAPFGPVMTGHTASVLSVAYSPSGQHLASSSDDKTIRQWESSTGAPFGPVMTGHTSLVTSVAYAPSGQYLASSSEDKTARQWESSTGAPFGPVMTGHTERVNSVVYSPSGQYLASGSNDRTIRQWESSTGTPFGPVMTGHTFAVISVAYSPSSQYLASSGWDDTVRQWESSTGAPFGPVMTGHTAGVLSVAYSPSSQYLVSSGWDNTIRQWESSTGAPFGPVMTGHTNCVNNVVYSPSGQYLASSSRDKTVRQWESSTGAPFGPVIAGHTDCVNSVVYSPSGQYLASGSNDRTIRQWESSTGALFGPVMAHTLSVRGVAYSPSGQHLASSSDDKTVRQWESSTGAPFGPVMTGHTAGVLSVAYSPSGQYLASSSDDKTIRQWESSTGAPFGPVMTGHTASVTSVAYSPSGQYLASSSIDKTVRQWESSTGAPFGPVMTGHTNYVTSVAYSADGQYLASSEGDDRIIVWQALTGLLVWCTRSASNSLFTRGLVLTDAIGLQPAQCALLSYAGCEEADAMKEKILRVSQNRNTLFASSDRGMEQSDNVLSRKAFDK